MWPESIRRVETELTTELPTLVTILHESVDNEGAVIVDELEQNLAMVEYATKLDQVLSAAPTDESWRVAYRSIHFAASVSDLLRCGLVFDFTVFNDVEPAHLRDYIIDITQTYMGGHPSIDNLTGAFMPELDPSGEYSDMAETVVALLLIQLERGSEGLAAAEAVDAWDGIIE
ncbi:hypothetical protein B7Y92_01840 [Candidatus Saccharibacteria bacterium 32-50-13]|nr:MAG: hypothetical protein B7Y92_01840 [Candidatus Saccharibacteria bacterium 32-50-13]